MRTFITASVIVFLCISFSSVAPAAQVTGCHCFKNRQFDPARPGEVDPYLLATTQNSFLAAVFGIDKKQIVRAKMGGVSGDDLWIAHFAAAKTGTDVKAFMASRKASGSWKKALAKDKVDPKRLGASFAEALAGDASDNSFSAIVVDRMVVKYFGVKESGVKKLRAAGAQNKEVILSVFLSERAGRPATDYFAEVKSGKSTWGAHLNNLKIEAKNMGAEINKKIKK